MNTTSPVKVPSLAHKWRTLPRRIPRTPHTGTKLAGVCEGIGVRYYIDPTLVRIVFVVSAFTGFGIIGYLLAWMVMPRWGSNHSPAEMVVRTPTTPEESNEKSTGILLGLIIALWLVFGSGALVLGVDVTVLSFGSFSGLFILVIAWWVLYLLHPQVPPSMQGLFPQNLSQPTAMTESDSFTMSTPNNNQPIPGDQPNPGEQPTAAEETRAFDPVYPQIVTSAPTSTGVQNETVATALKIFGWFAFIVALGTGVLAGFMAYAVVQTDSQPWLTALIAIMVGSGVILAGTAITLVCYAKFKEALIAAISVAILMAAVFTSLIAISNYDDYGAGMYRDDTTWAESTNIGEHTVTLSHLEAEDNNVGVSFTAGELTVDGSYLDPLTQPITYPVTMKAGTVNVLIPQDVPTVLRCSVGVGENPCEEKFFNADAAGAVLTMTVRVDAGEVIVYSDMVEENTQQEFTARHNTTEKETVTVTVTKDAASEEQRTSEEASTTPNAEPSAAAR